MRRASSFSPALEEWLWQYRLDKMVRVAVERRFITIGEAVKQLNLHHPAIDATFSEKAEMIAFRNVIVHEYWAIDDETSGPFLFQKYPR